MDKLKTYEKFSVKKTKDKFKDSWNSFSIISKREIKETGKLIELLKKGLSGEKLSQNEIKYIKAQSGDLAKIVGIMAMGSVSMIIPITLNKVLSKWGINILPKEQIFLLDEKEKGSDDTVK